METIYIFCELATTHGNRVRIRLQPSFFSRDQEALQPLPVAPEQIREGSVAPIYGLFNFLFCGS